MLTYAEKHKATQRAKSPKATVPAQTAWGTAHEVQSILHLQCPIGNAATLRLPQSDAEERDGRSVVTASPPLRHDLTRIQVNPSQAGPLRAKLEIRRPGDTYEQEADRAAEHVMGMPEPRLQRVCADGGECPTSQEGQVGQGSVRWQANRVSGRGAEDVALQTSIHEGPSGLPMDSTTRTFMESRFSRDFSRVRVHTDAEAAKSARAVYARAYTVGSHIVFGESQYAPATLAGRRLLAHELAHVVQQGSGSFERPTRVIQRLVGGDVTQTSITPGWARDLTDGELTEQTRIVRGQIAMGLFGSAETEEVARVNLVILEAESGRRRRQGARSGEEHQETRERGGYRDQAVAISYDRIVTLEAMSNPNPQSGFDQSEINRIALDPRLLEQVYYDAVSGNPRARWLVQQYEGVAGALGRYIARRLNAWECLIINCTVNWEQVVFSPSTRSGRHLREILSASFEREGRRIGLNRQIVANVLMLVVAGATAKSVLAREAPLAGRAAPMAEGAAAERTAAEARSVAGGGQPAVMYRGTTYRYVEGGSQMVHDLGEGTYWSYEMSQGVRFAQIRRAEVQGIEAGAPGVVLRAEVPSSELGRVLDFYNNPALRREWEAFARSQPGGQYVLRGSPAEMYNAHFQNWLQSRGMRLKDFDVVVGPDYIHGGSQICIRNPGIASRVLRRSREAARVHEPVTPSYPEIPEH